MIHDLTHALRRMARRPASVAAIVLTLGKPAASQVAGIEPPSAPPTALLTEIERGAANQLYAVDLRFAEPTSVGEIRAVSSHLEVPRVLARIEYGAHVGGRPRGMVILGLGEMYESDAARQHSECRALAMVNLGANELREAQIAEWPVSQIHVYATAHVIRELTSSRLLPPATIVDGYAQKPEHLQKIEEYTRNEITQPISKPGNVDLPPHCAKFVGVEDAPTLSRDFPREFQAPAALEGETFRAFAFRLLAQLPSDTAVTIDLKLNVPANVDFLASLVREYQIRGLRADLVPAQSTKKVIAEAQLSDKLELGAQIHRVRCQMRLGLVEPQASSEWYADWISVSLSTANAVLFLSHQNLAQAQVTGIHPLGDLDRLQGYYERLATRVYEMPTSIEIPDGCENVYQHNGLDEVGSLGAQPPSQ